MTTQTRIYTHADCLAHQPGPHHPESPARLEAVLGALRGDGFAALDWAEAPLGTREQVLRVHDADYVDAVEAAQLPGDITVSPASSRR
jgi:acetoin utilization deacetylase AcuC-like enzyme